MTSGKCPHPWNRNKKGTFTNGHKQINKGRGCFKKGKLNCPKTIEINRDLGKKRYSEGKHPFYELNKYAQDNALPGGWYGIGKARWKKLSKEVLLRDNFTCQKCGRNLTKYKYQCHHKIPYAISKDNSKGNLVSLCTKCHMKEEAKVRKRNIQISPKLSKKFK
jgi:hypothetical protein